MKRVLLAALLSASWAAFAEGPAAAPAADPIVHGDAAAGSAKAAACAACHGPNGNSSNPEWPKLAGQGGRYIYEQLKAFKTGVRKSPIMMPMAASQSDQDMRDLAAHFAAQPAAPGVASPEAAGVAQKIYRAGGADQGLPACMSCHGPNGAGNPAAAYPRIGGQHATYVAARLRDYRARAAEPLPEGNLKTMAAVAAKLSDKEVDALASYVNGLR
ncbi:MAG TPA: c-type cytochrome [Solimonas sp.]|nr:c-type cytochrome [Solimonas sp.]